VDRKILWGFYTAKSFDERDELPQMLQDEKFPRA
jgi:hypothetical protein